MQKPEDMTIEQLNDHIERRKRVIAREVDKPRYKRDEKYINGLIEKQRLWIAIRASKEQQLPLF